MGEEQRALLSVERRTQQRNMTMADDTTEQKKGLTPFGWLLLGGGAAALLIGKERRTKVLDTVRGWTGQAKPGS
jgi:hypothetical protein